MSLHPQPGTRLLATGCVYVIWTDNGPGTKARPESSVTAGTFLVEAEARGQADVLSEMFPERRFKVVPQ